MKKTEAYHYFVEPKNPFTAEAICKIPGAELFDEQNFIYEIDPQGLKVLFNKKRELQGTLGRAGTQVINFYLYRKFKNGEIKIMNEQQIENLLRRRLALKPKYLQRGKNIVPVLKTAN
jgi:hypothetical protein